MLLSILFSVCFLFCAELMFTIGAVSVTYRTNDNPVLISSHVFFAICSTEIRSFQMLLDTDHP